MTELRTRSALRIISHPQHHGPSPGEPSQESERVGLDLVTFSDHPYQPRFLDTWTLLSWVAAQTRSITVCGNVLNLPLRPPAVLARSAASLDLLSGGRFELGLGAGGVRLDGQHYFAHVGEAGPAPATTSASGWGRTSPQCWAW